MVDVKPYAAQPSYADVEYIDGKLRVARICAQSERPETARRWQETIDILLEQRSMLTDLQGDLS